VASFPRGLADHARDASTGFRRQRRHGSLGTCRACRPQRLITLTRHPRRRVWGPRDGNPAALDRPQRFHDLREGRRCGGTWRENTYPGCACDIASHLSSFSFEQDSGWSRTYAPQPEILRNLERVAAEHRLSGRIHFNTEIVRLDWDDARRHWQLTAADGRRFTADVVVAGVGGLHGP